MKHQPILIGSAQPSDNRYFDIHHDCFLVYAHVEHCLWTQRISLVCAQMWLPCVASWRGLLKSTNIYLHLTVQNLWGSTSGLDTAARSFLTSGPRHVDVCRELWRGELNATSILLSCVCSVSFKLSRLLNITFMFFTLTGHWPSTLLAFLVNHIPTVARIWGIRIQKTAAWSQLAAYHKCLSDASGTVNKQLIFFRDV